MCAVYICAHKPWTRELSPTDGAHKHIQPCVHVHTPTPSRSPTAAHDTLKRLCDFVHLFYICVSPLLPLHPEPCAVLFFSSPHWHLSCSTWGVQGLGLSPATSLLAVIVHYAVPTSALLGSFYSCHCAASNPRRAAERRHHPWARASARQRPSTSTSTANIGKILLKKAAHASHNNSGCLWHQTRSQPVQLCLVFVKQKDYSYILHQQAQTLQITLLAGYSWNMYAHDSSTFPLVHELADQIGYEFH